MNSSWPGWLIIFCACLFLLGGFLGELDGLARGVRREVADRRARLEEKRAVRDFQLLREPVPMPPELAHEWEGHVGQALALANQPCHPECFGPRCRCHQKTADYLAYHLGEQDETDAEFDARMAAAADEIIAWARAALAPYPGSDT